MTSAYLYWITRLDMVRTFIELFNVIAGLGVVFGTIAWFIAAGIKKTNEQWNTPEHTDSDWRKADNFQKGIKTPVTACIITFFVAMFCNILVPSTKEMIAIDVIPKVCSNQQLKDIGQDMLDVAASWLKDMKNEKKNSSETKAE